MSEFNFEAISATGVRSQGMLTANNEREAMAQLDGRALFPVWIKPKQEAGRRLFGGRVGGRHMATFYSQLADLLRSGVPLLRSLDLLERMGTNKRLQTAVRDV